MGGDGLGGGIPGEGGGEMEGSMVTHAFAHSDVTSKKRMLLFAASHAAIACRMRCLMWPHWTNLGRTSFQNCVLCMVVSSGKRGRR